MSNEQRNQITEDNLGLVHMVVSKLGIRESNREDAIQAGTIGLMTGATKVVSGDFDPSRSAQSTYLVLWISQAVRRFLRNTNLIHVPEHAQAGGGTDSANIARSCGSLEVDIAKETVNTVDNVDMLKTIMATLSESDRNLLVASVVDGDTNTVIGARVGKSREWVRLRLAKITQGLREVSNA
jgi:RNA polymerase sigma factor (sigma-70 family)